MKATGVVRRIDDLGNVVPVMAKIRKVFTPNQENSAEYKTLYKKYANLYNAAKGLR